MKRLREMVLTILPRRRRRKNMTISRALDKYDDWFQLRISASVEITDEVCRGCSSTCLWVFIDAIDDYVHIGEGKVLEAMRRFTRAVIDVFGLEYLVDGIYPTWATFVKIIPRPQSPKRSHLATMQESTRKDVERAFGVLQKRFAIIRGLAEYWKLQVLWKIRTRLHHLT
jgi:hypothetical protein